MGCIIAVITDAYVPVMMAILTLHIFLLLAKIHINQGHVLTHLIYQQDGRHQIHTLCQGKHTFSITSINPNKHREELYFGKKTQNTEQTSTDLNTVLLKIGLASCEASFYLEIAQCK